VESLRHQAVLGTDVNGALLTAQQVAKLLGVPPSWVYEQSRRGSIPTVALGRYRRYRAEAILEWVKEREARDEVDTLRQGGGNGTARISGQRMDFSGRTGAKPK
jgi:excisionase family DNA binding protein